MGKTIAEKILANHSNKDVSCGDFVVCSVDFCFGQDGTSNIIIDTIKSLNIKKKAKSIKFCMVIDHNAPSPNMQVSYVHNKMRRFVKDYQGGLCDVNCGICHQVIPERGYVLPGDLVLGADSHTCTYGALGAFASGVGSTDLAITLATGKNWFRVPHTLKIILEGNLKKGVFAKDIILYLLKKITTNGATYKAIEFYGSLVSKMDMDSRFTVSNMAVEMGAKCAFLHVDKKTLQWVEGRTKRKIKPVFADKKARYFKTIKFDLSKLVPMVAKPHSPDNVIEANKLKEIKIDQAFLGTCTNGRLSDLKIASLILKGRNVNPSVKLIVAPASSEIYLKALKSGVLKILLEAGAIIINPGCGPCVGTHAGIPADGEQIISTANRNFKGRMGNPNAFIYLASPATVAASAIMGRITDPRKFLN